MEDSTPPVVRKSGASVASNSVPDLASSWLELEFYTQSQQLKGQISCPAGERVLDLLNAPGSLAQQAKVEFIELEDYPRSDNYYSESKTVCVKKDDILFVTAPDPNMGRGLGAKGEFKVYPFVPKTPLRVNIELTDYSLTGNLFRAKNQTMIDVLNNGMFFLPLTDVVIGKNCFCCGERPFVAVNKKQIHECRETYLSGAIS